MAYVVGNWSIEPRTVDSITTTKNLPIPDLSWSADYSAASVGSQEAILINHTGPTVKAAEKIRLTRKHVANIYQSGLSSSLDVCGSEVLNCTDGLNVYAELAYLLKATNSVSGEELAFPLRGSIGFTIPTADFITAAALEDLVRRLVATMYGTGQVDGAQAVKLARGDLNPTDDGSNA